MPHSLGLEWLVHSAAVMTRVEAHRGHQRSSAVLPTVLLGIGLGGFFDGIVLHQILQWHHMLSAHTPPDSLANLQLNTLADGLFHASAWIFTSIGLLLLWAAVRGGTPLGWSRLIGGLLAGWGGFNVVEGIIDHQILGLHHVRPGPDEILYDMGFLIWGAIMLVVGVLLLRRVSDDVAATH
jgi:uncharacterized membrane protein